MSLAADDIHQADEADLGSRDDASGDPRSSSVLSQAYSQPDPDQEDHTAVNSDSGGSEDSNESDEERPNRYQGPDSTWRGYTQDERGLAAALDQQRANDLSIHLYNAHAQKARHYDTQVIREPWRSKRSWMQTDEDGSVRWCPDRDWTAWPLPPDDVPRQQESFGATHLSVDEQEQGSTYRKVESWKPSGDLEEIIAALMLRKGHEQFSRRFWAQPFKGNVSENQSDGLQKDDGSPDEALLKRSDAEGSPSPVIKTEVPDSEGQRMQGDTGVHKAPEFIADDDRAHGLLKSTARHILSQLDDLLMGLHKNRQGHFTTTARLETPSIRSRSASRTTLKRKASAERLNEQMTLHDGAPGDAAVRSRRSSLVVGMDTSTSLESPALSRHNSANNRRQPGLRDWSEILGIASLTGWEQAVVDRAAQRCASMFGEGMTFRKMPERPAIEYFNRAEQYFPVTIPKLKTEIQEDDEEDLDDVVELHKIKSGSQGYHCPFTSCSRYHEPYPQGRRWREHLKKSHKLDRKQIKEIEAKMTDNPRPEGLGQADEDGDGSEVDATEEATLSGGVHVDGFMQPIQINLQRGRDVKERRKRSTDDRATSKRRRLRQNVEERSEAEVSP